MGLLANFFKKAARSESKHPITIKGDDTFVKRTQAALDLIYERDPKLYQIVIENIGIIRSAKKSGMVAYGKPPVYNVGDATSQSETIWYASTICHDAFHSKLYHDYYKQYGRRPSADVWTGRGAENACLSVQEVFLKNAQAPLSLIQYVQSQRTVDYFSSYEDRTW